MVTYFNVKGVTFPNADGTNRQDIIKSLFERGIKRTTAVLEQTTFQDERAVAVYIDGAQVGFVPRTCLSEPISYEKELVAIIGSSLIQDEQTNECKQIYWVQLSYSEEQAKRLMNK